VTAEPSGAGAPSRHGSAEGASRGGAAKLSWRLVELALVLVVALASLGFQLWLPSTHVEEKDYQDVARVLASEAQPGDAVLLAPWWTEKARIYLPNLEVVGYQGSELDDLELNPRVWVLSEPRLPKADYPGFYEKFAPSRTAVGQMREFGNLRLQLFTNGRYRPLTFNAAQLLPQSQVYVESPDGQRQGCQWDGQRSWRCGQSQVLIETREIMFAPHTCIRLWPPGGSSKLVLELPPVPASASIGLRTGMVWDRGFFHDARLTPTTVNLEANGQVTSSITLAPGLTGVQRSNAPGVAEGSRVRVTSQSQNAELRELCVEVYGFAK
jgi:hypothetical protein